MFLLLCHRTDLHNKIKFCPIIYFLLMGDYSVKYQEGNNNHIKVVRYEQFISTVNLTFNTALYRFTGGKLYNIKWSQCGMLCTTCHIVTRVGPQTEISSEKNFNFFKKFHINRHHTLNDNG